MIPQPRPVLYCKVTSKQLPDGMWEHTSKCGVVRQTPAEWPTLRRECEQAKCYEDIPDDHPTFTSKAFSFSAAMLKWIRAGRPMRRPAEMAECFAICQGCPKFIPTSEDRSKGTCKVCGCGLAKVGGMMNKISMATEHCPLKKPKW
jgi:hypothetical protein